MTQTVMLDLTGPKSHKLKMEAGRGDLRIGPKDGSRKPDLVVAPDDVINWAVFDAMHTGAGYNWPRIFYYEGNDTGLFEWMRVRETETAVFRPRADLDIDMCSCLLGNLTLEPGQHRLRVALPSGLRHLSIRGNPGSVEFSRPFYSESLTVDLADDGDFVLSELASIEQLRGVQKLSITRKVLGDDGFDCASLAEFKTLKSLCLHGGMRNLDALADLPLQALELRYVPDLTGLPDFSVWRLSRFIGWNVERERGKALQGWIKAQAPEGYFSVNKLRDTAWFVEEYGLPFGAWPSKSGKAASKAYKLAAKVLAKAGDKPAAERAIGQFVEAINALSGIETSEREDVGDAVSLLAATRPDVIGAEQAQAVFDAVRNF